MYNIYTVYVKKNRLLSKYKKINPLPDESFKMRRSISNEKLNSSFAV